MLAVEHQRLIDAIAPETPRQDVLVACLYALTLLRSRRADVTVQAHHPVGAQTH